jgi:hypothetical protein
VKQQVGPQTFIVKSLIIRNTDNHPIHIKMERRGKRLVTGETERERVCVRDRESLKMEVASVLKMAIGGTDHLVL